MCALVCVCVRVRVCMCMGKAVHGCAARLARARKRTIAHPCMLCCVMHCAAIPIREPWPPCTAQHVHSSSTHTHLTHAALACAAGQGRRHSRPALPAWAAGGRAAGRRSGGPPVRGAACSRRRARRLCAPWQQGRIFRRWRRRASGARGRAAGGQLPGSSRCAGRRGHSRRSRLPAAGRQQRQRGGARHRRRHVSRDAAPAAAAAAGGTRAGVGHGSGAAPPPHPQRQCRRIRAALSHFFAASGRPRCPPRPTAMPSP